MVKQLLKQVVAGQHLSRDQAAAAFEEIMSGTADSVATAGLLAAMATKGETVDEIVGAAQAMRQRMRRVQCDPEAVDTCGTGGDGISTFNVSTTAAIIAAAAGVTVAKHGNCTNTRASGSAEVLEALGVNLDADVATVERCLRETKVGFLYARALHPAMKHAAPLRSALGIRTIFNLLGPLSNPAAVRRQVLGVPRPQLTELLAGVLRELGASQAWVVHGSDGLCDLTITGDTRVSELRGGEIRTLEVAPEDCGLTRAKLDDIRADSAAASAEAVRGILAGDRGPRRDHALLNAGAAVLVAGRANDLRDGVDQAAQAVDSGKAAATLAALVEISQGR